MSSPSAAAITREELHFPTHRHSWLSAYAFNGRYAISLRFGITVSLHLALMYFSVVALDL